MKKLTVKEATYNIKSAMRSAKMTYLEGFLYQGYKQETYKREALSIERLRKSKAKTSKLLLSRMIDNLTDLEDKAWEQQQKRIILIKKMENHKIRAFNAIKISTKYIIEKLELKNTKTINIIDRYENTYIKYILNNMLPSIEEIDVELEQIQNLRNELVTLNQK